VATPDFILELRRRIGHDLLWLPAVTAIVLDPPRERMLAVRRADNGTWTPVTGIVDPGEEPATAVVREVLEEADIECTPVRLIDVRAHPPQTHVNGDRAQYLVHCFVCEHVSGDPSPADGENTEARWFPVDQPPPMKEHFLDQLQLALEDRPETRFRR
jgi:8-oxo-dGTP pyrophosphatase MutT (NUDIX family)